MLRRKEFISEFAEVTECLEDNTETFLSVSGSFTPRIGSDHLVAINEPNNDVSP
jgi:hypothetical protein